MKSITVVVITYNQENVIGRALDSILCQMDFGLKSIIVCDDCSPDNNWDVICSYKERYPLIIDAHRNNKNKGIYGNMEQALSYLRDTDLVILCSGDDALCDGYFKTLQSFIEEQKIDTNKAISIFSDWKTMSPSGEGRLFKNTAIDSTINPVSAKLRGLVFNRSVASSKSVFDQFTPLPLEKGLAISEGVFDLMLEQHSASCFYLPFVGSIYYTGIGVSMDLSTAKYVKEEASKWLYYKDYLTLSTKDKYYCLFNYHYLLFLVNAKISDSYKTLFYYLKSWDSCSSTLKDFLFIFMRVTKRLISRKKVDDLK